MDVNTTLLAIQHPRFRKEKTVTMIFPKRVILNIDNHDFVRFEPGTQEVPESLSSHWYVKGSGAVLYQKPEDAVADDPSSESDSEALPEDEPEDTPKENGKKKKR